MIAIAYTLSFCFLGAQMIRWLMPRKSPLVRAWLGVSLGVLMEMGLPALCANALDFTVAAHIAAVAAALLLAALCYAAREKAPLCRMSAADRRQMAVMSAIYAQHHARRGRLALVRAGDIRRFVHAPVVCHVA